MKSEIIYKNDHVSNIYGACTCCYNNIKDISYLEKENYIAKRVNAGHDSILEHGKLAIKITDITNLEEIIELTTSEFSRYLEFYTENYYKTKSKLFKKNELVYNLIINGNMRSYKYFLHNISSYDVMSNQLIRSICYLLSDNTVKELYGKDFTIDDIELPFTKVENFFNEKLEDKFNADEKSDSDMHYTNISRDNIVNVPVADNKVNKTVDIGIDLNMFKKLYKDEKVKFDLIPYIIPVTVVFKNVSRTATHQIVRHRNAITQESQRYVDSSNASFTIPMQGYTPKEEYGIKLCDAFKYYTLDELANELISVYSQLLADDKSIKKEEARGYLPANVNCRKLYMTFSLFSLSQFIKLRTDPHAQYEIRQYAITIRDTLGNMINDEFYSNQEEIGTDPIAEYIKGLLGISKDV